MESKLNMTRQKERTRVRMRTRLLALVLLVVLLQLLTSSAALIIGGGFRDLRGFSYHTLAEKTTNCAASVRGKLTGGAAAVQAFAVQAGTVTEDILKEQRVSADSIRTDKALAESILSASDTLLRGLALQAGADEAILMLAVEEGTVLRRFPDSGKEDAGFCLTAMRTATDDPAHAPYDLGYWGSFSAPDGTAGVGYALPLIAEDGTVYGALGIGLREENILTAVEPNAALCYVMGVGGTEGSYVLLSGAGEARKTLLGHAKVLHISGTEGEGISRFDMATEAELAGCVEPLSLYSESSPYVQDNWALISVADRNEVLAPFLELRRQILTAVLLGLFVVFVVAVPGCGIIIRPLTGLSRELHKSRKYNEVVRFEPSKIYEIEEITDAITQMQIRVHGFSSQVSKMIAIADVGLGTFMYDRTDNSVFIGQSLIQVLGLDLPQGEDIVMERGEFLTSIPNAGARRVIDAVLDMPEGTAQRDFSKVYEISRTSGGTLWMRLTCNYSSTSTIGIVQDITESVLEKNRIEYERDYDQLTGLLNRHAYYRRVEKLFQDRSALQVTAFVMTDLDNLKYVNDTYGHNYGDDYIRTAAAVLRKFQDYGGIVSRLSGDEFSICLPGFSSKEEVRALISEVHTELLKGSCLLADGTHFKVSGSMGVSWYPDDSESRELLMKYADFAMYTIKHSTKGGVAEFDYDTYAADAVLLTGVEELNRIIEENAVRYAFQSIVSARTGEVFGYEALMRVQSDIFRSPLELLRMAKTGAKLHEIERMTWTRAIADFREQTDAGNIAENAHIFINSIANNRLRPEVEQALEQEYPDILSRIVLEILESENAREDCTAHKTRLMQKWGANLALDDFGTGYNSEYALLSLRPHIIKIDRSIISGCDKDADRRMIIGNLVKLARAKGILVLAEGVETREELETAVSCGVDLLQGFYLDRPAFEPKPLDPALREMLLRLANAKRS